MGRFRLRNVVLGKEGFELVWMWILSILSRVYYKGFIYGFFARVLVCFLEGSVWFRRFWVFVFLVLVV